MELFGLDKQPILLHIVTSNGTPWSGSNAISLTATLAADDSYNNGADWDSIVWCPEITIFVACANGSGYGVGNDPVLMTSGNGTGWGAVGGSSTAGLYKGYLSICWAPEGGERVRFLFKGYRKGRV